MTVRIKICGINDEAACEAAGSAGADWMGFVFFPPSPRFITAERAAALAALAPSKVGKIGVFVEPTEAQIATVLGVVPLDGLQVYAAPHVIAALRRRFGLPVWHTIGIATASDLPHGEPGADRLVLEAKPPKSATRPGGNAAWFDWSLLRNWAAPAPWILAGGLTAGNVARAIYTTRAEGVDVSSGVETSPGVKSPVLISQFVAAARRA